jgi:tetratricopeptide (TPR) repeat protein
MNDRECVERIRLQHLGQPGNGLEAGLVSRVAADIASQCGVTRLKAHRLARGWTVEQAIAEFHRMCRREDIKGRGLTQRSWMQWESGQRPGWDYQDLVRRLLQASAVELGWAADYSSAGSAAPRTGVPLSSAVAGAGMAMMVPSAVHEGMRRSLLQLPPDIGDFTGRAEEIRRVSGLIAAAAGSTQAPPPIVCLSGQGGLGKTTLAVHVAHQVDACFPDGQLYASLRGADAGARDPADVLAGWLRELGVDGQDIPEGVDERARMYRARLAGCRVLVLLDGAADVAQVRPLLPGNGGCAVLVTSRSRLAALPGAHAVPLGTLPPDEAARMLAAIIGTDRAEGEPEAVAEVARLCGRLPLALRIAGARLVCRPAWTISWLAGRLRDESRRLDLLRAGDLEVRASFRLSYDSLEEAEQVAFRMLGMLPADFPAWALAAVLGTGADEAERLLEQLVDAALVDIAEVDASGLLRYRVHDLLRDFAAECLRGDGDAESFRRQIAGLAGEYTGASELALALVRPGSTARAGRLLAGDVVRGDPWGWLAAERLTLTELVGKVHAAGLREETWRLAEALPPLHSWRADWRSWERTCQLALDAARGADQDAEARILRSLGVLYRELGRYDEACDLLAQAAGIFAGYGDQHHRAACLRNLGDAYRHQGRLGEAIGAFTEALVVFRDEGDTRSVAGALHGMADAWRELSQWDESARAFLDCVALYRDLGDDLEEARAKVRYARVFRDQHLSGQALPLIAEGLEVVRRFGDQRWEARAMRQLAIVARNDGDTGTAIDVLSDCLGILGELEDRRGQAVCLRNRGDAHRLAGNFDDAAADLGAALGIFEDIGDRRWSARTRMSIGGLCRLRNQWDDARQHLDAALATFIDVGDLPAEGRALREFGLLLRDQGDLEGAEQALDASAAIFGELGDALWMARVVASRTVAEGLRGGDPAPLAEQATAICRQCGIAEENIASALKEW